MPPLSSVLLPRQAVISVHTELVAVPLVVTDSADITPVRPARFLRPATWVLLATGLLALAYAVYVAIDIQAYQAIEQRRFERARRHPPVSNAVASVPDGGAIGQIQIPRLALTAMVVQGDSAAILQRAVGHLADTALPGEPGNIVLAGHRDTFFRPLKDVRRGDAITLKTRDGDFEYLVESTAVVPPSDVRGLAPTGGRTLTLITCVPFSYIGSAPDCFIVRARAREQSRN